MKLKVYFREYEKPDNPYVDPETGLEDRGEYLWTFDREIEGDTPADILEKAGLLADELSQKNSSDVRVWEMSLTVTPRGIRQ